MKPLIYALAAVASLAVAAPAQADVLKVLSNTVPVTYDTTTPTTIDFNGAAPGGVDTAFNLPTSQLVLVTFFAECSIAGDFDAWVDIDLQIRRPTDADYVPLKPTNGDNAFCSGGSNEQNNWVSAATAGVIRVPAGISRVRAQVRRGFTSGTGSNVIRLDDMILIVQN